MSIFYKLPVKEITRETKDSVSIVFDIPENLKEKFNFKPGQYLTVQKELDGELVRRAYSICSSPNSKEVRVAVKAVEKGVFSVYANSKLKEGDVLEVAGPEGRFILETSEGQSKKYLAFAAGSGITPVLSMIEDVLSSEPNSLFVLVYGNKSIQETIFKERLDTLQKQYPSSFKLHYVFSQKLADNALFGRINDDLLEDLLKHKYHNTTFDQVFLCGPEEMVDTVQSNLQGHGYSEDQILFELFTSTSSQKEVKSDLSGNTNVKFILDEEETNLVMRQDEIILDAALQNNLDAPYSCQGGICSSCLAKVTEGKAIMENNKILSQEELDEGLILTCQAHPVTPEITIDFDDI